MLQWKTEHPIIFWVSQIGSEGLLKSGHKVKWIEEERWMWENMGIEDDKTHCIKNFDMLQELI